MRVRWSSVCILGVLLAFFLTACAPSNSVTDPTGTTTVVDITTATTYSSSVADATSITHLHESTRGNEQATSTTIPQNTTTTIYRTYAQKYKIFSTLDEYCDFVKTANEQTLRSIFTKKKYDGSSYFDEENFEIILKDRQYLLPVLPAGYAFKSIRMETYDPMTITLERDGEEYYIYCSMSQTQKYPSVEEDDSFLKQDGTKVIVNNLPDNALNPGGGTCYWEENGYECSANFTQTNKKHVWDLVKSFEMKIVPIK